MSIQPSLETFHKLTASRLFRIPEYQRTYSWTRKQRRDLFDDILALREKPSETTHFMATMVGLKREKKTIVTDEYTVIEVVDGQQRLTTLVILLKAVAKALDPEVQEHDKLSSEIAEWLVKQDELSLLLLQTNHDTSEFYVNYVRHGTVPPQTEAKTIAERELRGAIVDCEKFVEEWKASGDLLLLLTIMKNRLAFIFHEISDERVVYTVFEVLNSRGLAVAWLDRLKSALMAVAFEHSEGNDAEVVAELHRLWGEIYRTIGLSQGLGEEALRFAATLASSAKPSKVKGQEASVETLRSAVGQSPKKAIEQTAWILSVVKAVDVFLRPSSRAKAVTRIVHARLLATAIELRSDIHPEVRAELVSLWEKVSFRIFGLCRKDARTSVGSYVRLAWETVKGMPEDEIREGLTAIGEKDGVSIEWACQHLYDENCYEGWENELRYLLFRYEEHLAEKEGANLTKDQWERIWEASASKSIEHIYPQSKGSAEQSKEEIFVHRLGNLMLLPPGLNSSLSDKEPAEKVEAYLGTGLLLARDVGRRIQEAGAWTRDMIEQREAEILDWAKEHWG